MYVNEGNKGGRAEGGQGVHCFGSEEGCQDTSSQREWRALGLVDLQSLQPAHSYERTEDDHQTQHAQIGIDGRNRAELATSVQADVVRFTEHFAPRFFKTL